MPPSAFVGQQPISYNDELVYKGILKITPSFFEALSKLPRVSQQNQASSLIIGSSFAIVFVIIITCSRLWTRTSRLRAFGADDAAIIPAAIGCVANLALSIASERAGCLGKHVYDCTYEEFGWYYKLTHSNFPVFYFTVFLVKISIVFANQRITGLTSRRWQIAHWTYLALLMSALPVCVFLDIFACSPGGVVFSLQAIAKVPDPGTIKCLNVRSISVAIRTLHIVTDWLLLPVPIIILWQIQMPLSRKIRLTLIFCVGVISSIASIMRIISVDRVTPDLTYGYNQAAIWDVVDIFFATIVASLPALNGVVDIAIGTLIAFGSKSSSSLLSRLRSFGISSQGTGDDSTQLTDKDSFGAVGEDTNLGNNSDQFDESILRRDAALEP